MPMELADIPPPKRHARRLDVLTVLLLAVALVGQSACARPLQDILNYGTLRVGVALFTPWVMRDPSGELTGFEIDVARKLAEDMQVDVEFSVYPWDRIILGLEAGEVDIIAAGLTITPERALHVSFSQPYATGGTTLATNLESTANVTSLDDLNNPIFTIAAIGGSAAEELARRIFARAQLELFADAEAASSALIAGEVDAYMENEPVPTFLALENPSQLDVPVAEPLLPTPAGFAVAKGDPDFVNFLNAWITARESDTWLPTLHGYWFQTLRWRD